MVAGHHWFLEQHGTEDHPILSLIAIYSFYFLLMA